MDYIRLQKRLFLRQLVACTVCLLVGFVLPLIPDVIRIKGEQGMRSGAMLFVPDSPAAGVRIAHRQELLNLSENGQSGVLYEVSFSLKWTYFGFPVYPAALWMESELNRFVVDEVDRMFGVGPNLYPVFSKARQREIFNAIDSFSRSNYLPREQRITRLNWIVALLALATPFLIVRLYSTGRRWRVATKNWSNSRCVACSYPLDNQSGVCPECGLATDSE